MQNVQFGSKMKMAKNMHKTVVQQDYSFCVKKTAGKTNKYSRNETILKIGHLAKAILHARAIVFAKWSVWVEN